MCSVEKHVATRLHYGISTECGDACIYLNLSPEAVDTLNNSELQTLPHASAQAALCNPPNTLKPPSAAFTPKALTHATAGGTLDSRNAVFTVTSWRFNAAMKSTVPVNQLVVFGGRGSRSADNYLCLLDPLILIYVN
ncbi:hypothetical protein EYF80_009858 [Liparis tanakae]|uniref:Uncharacterized protein n=1 Tax=Liparis tanakae TaxID=230148 RepID=A0A4Z2IPR8_9TELE|nr:hypothetical protein EYF80_009858 [Liparis tanakae]